MTQSASNNFIISFDELVKQAYQGEMLLNGTVRTKRGVKGSSHKFPVMDQVIAVEKQRLAELVTSNPDQQLVPCILNDYNASAYSDIMDIDKLSYDERNELAKAVAKGYARRMDQMIIDACEDKSNSLVIAASTSGMTVDKILKAKRAMDENNVPDDGNRFLVMSAGSLETALKEEKIGNANYNIIRAIYEGKLPEYAGFKFKIMGNRKEGGLPISGTTRDNFAYHRDAIGQAIGTDLPIKIDWVPTRASWLINKMFSAGAVTIDDKGVFKIETQENPIA